MDDNAKNQVQTNQNIQNPTTVQSAVGQVHKEQEPVSSPLGSEYIAPSEKEPIIGQEIAELGVEKVSELPKITPDHERIGVQRAKESVEPSLEPSGKLQLPQLPMSEKEALRIIKTTNPGESKYGLALLIEKLYKQLWGLIVKQKVRDPETSSG